MTTDHAGTRFKLYPQLPGLESDEGPETIWVSPPPGAIGPGPSDDRMYVVEPIGKQQPYGPAPGRYGRTGLYLPPWRGPVVQPALPDANGHFDYLELGTPQFEMAHIFGSVRFTLDVWERYFGRRIEWHFRRDFSRLEIVHLRSLDNAFAGFGSIEVGAHFSKDAPPVPFSLSFDVLAHEVGHLIIYSMIGLPDPEDMESEYLGFHESAADMVSLITLLHFDSAIEELLNNSRGNLYTANRLNRFAELSNFNQMRMANNTRTLAEFAEGWSKEHDLSEPLTGALFDVWVDAFHESLLDGGLISGALEDFADEMDYQPGGVEAIQGLFDEAFSRDPAGFKAALAESRDYMGFALAAVFERLLPENLIYEDVRNALLDIDQEINRGRYRRIILNNFNARAIGLVGAGPRLAPPDEDSHAFSARTIVPAG